MKVPSQLVPLVAGPWLDQHSVALTVMAFLVVAVAVQMQCVSGLAAAVEVAGTDCIFEPVVVAVESSLMTSYRGMTSYSLMGLEGDVFVVVVVVAAVAEKLSVKSMRKDNSKSNFQTFISRLIF